MSGGRGDALLGAARAALQARDPARAAALCEEGLREAPGDARLHHALGYAHRMLGHAEAAERHYREALARDPGYFEALLNLGALYGQQGRLDEAEACYTRAAQVRPGLPHAHYNLGRLSQDRERPEQAAEHYLRALAADPAHAPSEMNLGDLAQQQGRLVESVGRYRRALELRPDYAAAHNNLGTALQQLGEGEAAIAHYRAALGLEPEYAEALYNLGTALAERGARDEAEACYRRLLALEPGNPKAGFALAALRGENPESPPAEHVRSLFDDYAARFDAHLQQRLGYRVPELLAARLRERAGAGAAPEVLDLGCGTGLFGAAVAPWAGAVDGVDLSPRMLELARARGCYRRLTESDLAPFLAQAPPASYDLVAATDVFIYVGALEAVFAGVARTLRPGGQFAFSVETPAAPPLAGYVLQPTGRYAHAATYLERLLAEYGLDNVATEALTLRTQGDAAVPGEIWLARRRAPGPA